VLLLLSVLPYDSDDDEEYDYTVPQWRFQSAIGEPATVEWRTRGNLPLASGGRLGGLVTVPPKTPSTRKLLGTGHAASCSFLGQN
jgi:hypothetical protein